MRVLLTGGTGFIGSHTAVEMTQNGHDIVILDNFSNSDESVLVRLEEIIGKPIIFEEGDIRDYDRLYDVLKKHNIEAVVHFAGLKAVGESCAMPIEYFDNNVAGTITLLRAMKALSIKKLIFSSSATVYGIPQYLPFDEKHPLSCTNHTVVPSFTSKKFCEMSPQATLNGPSSACATSTRSVLTLAA